jgi:hypothetical protein
MIEREPRIKPSSAYDTIGRVYANDVGVGHVEETGY